MALIWLAVRGKDDQPIRLVVDGDAKSVAGAIPTQPKLVRLERGEQAPVWVNPRHVLYVEETPEAGN